ncbi:hypothetical protein PQR75_37745 [Paraburkholderia fungorum]|uniref:hypothetical protein n=1 Tax=Paraburkholderia fungorum TaxID=134537 RepID=UPI0038BA89EC
MTEQLWCVHIEGPNDFIATASHDVAQQEALAINAYLDKLESGQRAALVRGVAIEWPFAPESHARSLVEDWHDLQRMSHRQANVAPPKGVLANISRRMKWLVSVARGN